MLPDSNTRPWYLTDVSMALQLDETSGNVFMNTGIQGNVYITGPVSIPGTVQSNIIGGNSNVVVTLLPPITGNVNANITGGNSNVVVTSGNINANCTGNVTVTQGTSPWVVTGNITTGGNSNVSIVGTNLDAFGRLRVSNPHTLFESALAGQRRYDFSSQTANGGTVNFNYNANVREMTVGTAPNSSVVRESMLVFPYQPGKSLLIFNSVVFADSSFNVLQRAGYFDINNGVYLQQDGKIVSFVIRSSSTGAITSEVINQSNWNNDPLDGTGPSGIILDMSASQLFFIEIAWLGVGSVRCGFVIDGNLIVCHTFNHANISAFNTTYMGSAVLPLRFEITSTAAGLTSPATLQQICSTVISEGGYDQAQYTFTAGTDVNTIRLTSSGTYYPIASIRLNSGALNSVVKVSQVDILSPTVNYYRWAIVKNATLTGATWSDPSSTARVDVDTAATAVTGGTEVQSGYASSRENVFIGESNFYARLGRTVTGVSDTFTLVLTSTNNNSDVCAQLGWQEIL